MKGGATMKAPVELRRIELQPDEITELDQLSAELAADYTDVENPELLTRLPVAAARVPERIRTFLTEFRLEERGEVSVIGGLPIDQEQIGATPPHWSERNVPSPTVREEIILVLFGSVLGDVFGWATQQNGALVHDLLPIRGHEHGQVGSGSADQLIWHTEEAFHPLRCDYLGLMSLRNPQRVGTTVAGVSALDLSDADRALLASRQFIIRPDDSHLAEDEEVPEDDEKAAQLLAEARHQIEVMEEAPDPIAVLAGDPEDPYLCVDPYYMDVVDDDAEARGALDRLVALVDRRLYDLALLPGETCFIDNYRAVHGRRPFRARYDGSDRWLKRINVSRDIRRSRQHRLNAASRIVY